MDGTCSKCPFRDRYCKDPATGRAPAFCSSKLYEEPLRCAEAEYDGAETLRFAKNASLQERACYEVGPWGTVPLKSRLRETVEFAKRMGYRRLGLAFCLGLATEAKVAAELLEKQGFEVVSVICKVGGVDKSRIGVDGADKIVGEGHESMCNPIGQAYVLNAAKTEFNILFGLCVGHDSLFTKYSDALCTTLVVKDRLLGHNPIAAIYGACQYQKYMEYPVEGLPQH